MPYTLDQQVDLAYNTVVRLNDLAEDSYNYAKNQLGALVEEDRTLNLGVVDVTIGDDATINWAATYSAPDAPVEPTYTNEVDEPTLPEVVVPAEVGVDARPSWGVDLSGTPSDLSTYTFSAIPTLDALPEIAVDIPTMDVSLLEVDPLNDFVEPVYVERVSAEVKAGILSVLGGSLGLPAGYWDAEWARVSGDIAKQALAETRRARNAGARSYWALPSEAVLAGSRKVLDDASRRQALARMEQAKQAAVFAREDFWQAVQQGIAYENQWINAHDRVAQRALASAEQIYGVRVQVHNANVNRYNAMLEAAKLDGTIDDLQSKQVLAKLSGELQASAQEIAHAGHLLEDFKARWQGYQVDKTTQISAMGEQIKFWNGQVDADTRYQALQQGKGKLDLDLMAQQISKVQGIASATSSLLQARTAAARFGIEAQTAGLTFDQAKNAIEVEITKITQAAQEAAAKINVAQSQWLYGQGVSLKQNIAQLAYGYAQAAVAASDVSFGRSISSSFSESESASRNAELVW